MLMGSRLSMHLPLICCESARGDLPLLGPAILLQITERCLLHKQSAVAQGNIIIE